MTAALFSPIKVGNLNISHRVVLCPLTRCRAYANHTPGPHAPTYYAQRASVPGTLVITEATMISQEAGGCPFVPGIYTQEQIAGWKQVTDAVHEKGSFIFSQLWALGRAAYPAVLAAECGAPLVSASPIALSKRPDDVPHALTEPEIKTFINYHITAARNAMEAGFDGVEIHAANGYLIDQFLQELCNKREDAWGGSIEKRARFALEVVEALVNELGPGKVGIRLSPWSTYQDMGLPDPKPQFSYLVNRLKDYNLAYLHVIEPGVGGIVDQDIKPNSSNDFIHEIWCKDGEGRVLISAGGYTRQTALEKVEEKGGMVAFGRLFIPNPDLPTRLKYDLPLAVPNHSTFYMLGDHTGAGYIDFPVSDVVIEPTGL